MSTVSSVSFHIFQAESLRVLLAIFLHRPWAVGLKLCWFTLKESFVGWCWLKENVWKCYGKPLLLPPSMEDLPLCRKQSGQLSNPNSLATTESHPLRLSFSVPSARHSRTNQLSWCAATYDSKIQVVTYKTICFSACKLMQTANTNALLCSSSRYHWGKMLKISWDWCQQNSGYKHLQPICLQPPKIATKEHERSEQLIENPDEYPTTKTEIHRKYRKYRNTSSIFILHPLHPIGSNRCLGAVSAKVGSVWSSQRSARM
jgi:hypothetical protein